MTDECQSEIFQGELHLLLGPTPQRHIREILSGKMDGRFLPQIALISLMEKRISKDSHLLTPNQ
jgi:hypothetical protein